MFMVEDLICAGALLCALMPELNRMFLDAWHQVPVLFLLVPGFGGRVGRAVFA